MLYSKDSKDSNASKDSDVVMLVLLARIVMQ